MFTPSHIFAKKKPNFITRFKMYWFGYASKKKQTNTRRRNNKKKKKLIILFAHVSGMNLEKLATSLIPLIDAFKQNPNLELEGSLGVLTEGNFKSGVDFKYFQSIHSIFTYENPTKPKVWSSVEPKSHFASFFYKGNIRGRYTAKTPPDIVQKTTVANIDIGATDRHYDLRVSLKEEIPLKSHIVTQVPEHVRLHQRWSFVYKDAFRYDLTKVASGQNKESACLSPPVFEVELELLRNQTFLNSNSSEQLAYHIIQKLIDLLGRFDTNHKPIPCNLRIEQQWKSAKKTTGIV